MESLAVRRLLFLAEHLKTCIDSAREIRDKLAAGEEVSNASRVEVEKLRNSSGRLVTEVHQLFQSGQHSDNIPEEMPTSLDAVSRLQIAAEDLLVELDIYMKPSAKTTREESVASSSVASRGHLPKLQLASFSGDILKWTEFWDRFTSVVDRRSDILDVDKLAYLVGSLEGDAKQSIHGLEFTNANYQIAVQKLKDRFGKPNLIVDAHYAALGRITAAKNTTSDCRRVLDTVERHLRTLENLGEDVNHNQLRTTIIEKFPQEIIYELRLDLETHGYAVKTLRESLEKILTARENSFAMNSNETTTETFTTEAFVTSEKIKPKRDRNFRSHGGRSQHQRRRSTERTKSRLVTSHAHYSSRAVSNNKRRQDTGASSAPTPKRRKLSCVYCKGDHYNDTCTEASTLEARKRILVQDKLCFQCLSSDHLIEKCTDKRKCYHCGVPGKHNRSICPRHVNKTSSLIVSE